MLVAIKHKAKAKVKTLDIDPKLYAALHADPNFKKFGCIYAVTKLKFAQGEVLCLTTSRLKAQRLCFAKSKKTRKAFYTKFIFDHEVPVEVLKALTKEIAGK